MTTDAVVVDVSEDWAIACDVQQRLMQRARPAFHALAYTARCRQLRAVGGDFYDFMPLSQNRLGLAIGDASGKSIAAALMMSCVQSSLRTAGSFAGEDPATVLRIVNSHVHATSLTSCYATVFYAVFDGNTRLLQYVNGGHNPPLVLRQDGSVMSLETGGLPVGILPNSDYEEGVVQLRAGDLLVAYTDGVTEATNEEGEEWGVERLQEAVRRSRAEHPERIADGICNALQAFSQGRQTDDATVVVACIH